MTLSEFATSLGLTVPQILARAIEVDESFLCVNPGSQVLSDEAEMRLRNLLGDSPQPRTRKSQRGENRRTTHGRGNERKKAGVNHKGNRTISAVADEYGVDEEELLRLALSLGYEAAANGGSLSVAQVSQLLLRLSESEQRSYGDTSSATIAIALENAGKLRDQPQSRKIRQSPNLRRTRLDVLAAQWGSSVAVLNDICRLVRIAIHDPDSPRIENDDLLRLRAALQASAIVADRWGMKSDVRLSKIASHCQVTLSDLRERCGALGITMLKRERIYRDDAVYLLVEVETARSRCSDVGPSEASERVAQPTGLDSTTNSILDLRLDGLQLTEQDFSFATLAGASFRGCELTRANFTGANLTGADFSGAILRYAVFDQAVLVEAVFDKADVRFARFGGAVLTSGQLIGALSEGAEFDSGARQ